MSLPTHHLDEDVLLDYLSGAASESVSLVAACHLTLCSECRRRAAAAEAVGGALLDGAPPTALSEHALEQVLAQLEHPQSQHQPPQQQEQPRDQPRQSPAAQAAHAAAVEADDAFTFDGIALPRPLRRYLTGADGRARSFHFLAPGIRAVDLPVTAAARPSGRLRTRLVRLAPGIEIPRHAHAGDEYTLVFAGGLSDDGEHYERGDVRFRATDAVHTQRVDGGAPCFALVVNEGALVPRTVRGKLISLLFDR